jgi:competence protein ComEC
MNQTLHQSFFLRFLFPLVLGMFFQYCTGQKWVLFYSSGLSLVFLIIHFIWKTYKNRWFFGVFVALFCFSGGMLLMQQAFGRTEWEWGDEELSCCGTLTEYPVEKKKTVTCRLQLSSTDRQVIVHLPKDSVSLLLLPGDVLRFNCRFSPLEKSDEAMDLDYEWYLRKQGYAATGFVREGQWMHVSHTSAWRYAALQYRSHLIDVMRTLDLSEKSFALNVAMTFGYRNLMDEDVTRSFTSAGISHLVAISGLHVQLIFMALHSALAFMGSRRKYRTLRCLIILPCIWAFTFMTGLAPSLVRAAVMITIYGIGEMLGKRSFTLNIVYSSATMMLLCDPLYLLDVGFQLSYAAVLSIVVIYPMLKRLHKTENPVISHFWSAFCISIAAQLGTAPLCLYYFHQFPVYFWITNMIIVPLSGPLLIGTLISIGAQMLIILPVEIYYPLECILQAAIVTAKSVEELPFSVIPGFYPDEIQTVLSYGLLFSAVAFFRNKNVRRIYLFQFFVLLQVIYYL